MVACTTMAAAVKARVTAAISPDRSTAMPLAAAMRRRIATSIADERAGADRRLLTWRAPSTSPSTWTLAPMTAARAAWLRRICATEVATPSMKKPVARTVDVASPGTAAAADAKAPPARIVTASELNPTTSEEGRKASHQQHADRGVQKHPARRGRWTGGHARRSPCELEGRQRQRENAGKPDRDAHLTNGGCPCLCAERIARTA